MSGVACCERAFEIIVMACEQGRFAAELFTKANHIFHCASRKATPAERICGFLEALCQYKCAKDATTDNVIRSATCKNMAVAHWSLACARLTSGKTGVLVSFKQALMWFQKAEEYGKGRDPAWQLSLEVKATSCWSDAQLAMQFLGLTDCYDHARNQELEKLVCHVFSDMTRAYLYLDIASYYLHWSDKALYDHDHQQSRRLLSKARSPLKNAQQCGQSYPSLVEVCQSLEDRVVMQQCKALSMQARVQAEELLGSLEQEDDDTVKMEKAWKAADLLRQAIRQTEGRDLIEESMALAALGKVYDKVLHMKEQARQCLVKVLELTSVLFPLTFTGEDWYDFARSTVERYQLEQKTAEEEEEEKQRQANLHLIKEEMEVLKAKEASLGRAEFLKFLYNTHPPNNPRHMLAEIPSTEEGSELKTLYQKAVLDYHPDRAAEAQHSAKWDTLTGEIFKILSRQYELYKDC